MIGVVIPAHNEEDFLGTCLRSVKAAASHPALAGEPVLILVVLDACSDGTERVAGRQGVLTLATNGNNVGHARSVGAAYALAAGARWLACTDADSAVSADWLVQQLACKADAVCGTVKVDRWAPHSAAARRRYEDLYQHREGHRHIHGANLGVCADAYRRAGGFRPLPVHEDVHLVEDLERIGARIAWTNLTRVVTSSRIDCRANGGFGDFLKSLA